MKNTIFRSSNFQKFYLQQQVGKSPGAWREFRNGKINILEQRLVVIKLLLKTGHIIY